MKRNGINTLDQSAIRSELDRVLHSRSFEGSDTHRRLLQYLAERAIAGDTESLKEYTVAVEALGRPATYDPRHESVVRLQVARLRNKLAEYYQGEGKNALIRLNLPKGGFRVFFDEVRDGPSAADTTTRWRLAFWVLACVLLLSVAYGVYTTARLGSAQREVSAVTEAWSPDLQMIWAPFLNSKRHLVICFGTPIVLNYPSHIFARLSGTNSWAEVLKSPAYQILKRALPHEEPMPWYPFTGTGEAGSGFLLGSLLGTRRGDITITRSNLLSWQEISDTNVIFLGPPKYNTQLTDIPIKQEIVIEPAGLHVLKPQGKEQEFYQDYFQSGPEFDGTTHALISCTPGLSGNGELLILAGNASPDTMAAAQWLTQRQLAAQLVSHVRLPSGEFPKYYQILIRVSFKNGVPVESSYVLHRVLQGK